MAFNHRVDLGELGLYFAVYLLQELELITLLLQGMLVEESYEILVVPLNLLKNVGQARLSDQV
jgi:hypothetical protein